jgi:hypothetical protein
MCVSSLTWLDWANFSRWGDCLLLTISWKLQKESKLIGLFFPRNKSYVASSTKRVGLHFTYICIKNKIKIPSCHTTIYQNFPFQGPPKKFLIWDCIVCKKIIWQPWAWFVSYQHIIKYILPRTDIKHCCHQRLKKRQKFDHSPFRLSAEGDEMSCERNARNVSQPDFCQN